MENIGLLYGVGIYDMLPASALDQYVNMEYNNYRHNLQRNNNISASNNSSVSTLNSPSVTSTNDKGYSLFSAIHKNIKYSYLSKTQLISVRRASDVMKQQIKIVPNKTWHSITIEYFLKNEDTKEVVSVMDTIINSSTHEIISQNKCQMRFLEKLVLNKTLIIN